MRAFITGGTGWIGSGIIRELIDHQHEVTALTRTPEGAAFVGALGATARPGDLSDLAGLRAAAAEADAVIHCAFDHSFGVLDGVGGMLVPASSSITQRLTGWHPTRPALLDDVRSAAYAREIVHAVNFVAGPDK